MGGDHEGHRQDPDLGCQGSSQRGRLTISGTNRKAAPCNRVLENAGEVIDDWSVPYKRQGICNRELWHLRDQRRFGHHFNGFTPPSPTSRTWHSQKDLQGRTPPNRYQPGQRRLRRGGFGTLALTGGSDPGASETSPGDLAAASGTTLRFGGVIPPPLRLGIKRNRIRHSRVLRRHHERRRGQLLGGRDHHHFRWQYHLLCAGQRADA